MCLFQIFFIISALVVFLWHRRVKSIAQRGYTHLEGSKSDQILGEIETKIYLINVLVRWRQVTPHSTSSYTYITYLTSQKIIPFSWVKREKSLSLRFSSLIAPTSGFVCFLRTFSTIEKYHLNFDQFFSPKSWYDPPLIMDLHSECRSNTIWVESVKKRWCRHLFILRFVDLNCLHLMSYTRRVWDLQR